MNLILFGFKGAGKTHFGKLLSIQMHRPFIDIDDLISEIYMKKTDKRRRAREIFAGIGESAFRELECDAVKSLTSIHNAIIALGGGTPLNPENLELLQKIGALVYLKVPAGTLKKRLLADELPSFFDKKDPEGSFYKMIQERSPLYESIPATKFEVDKLDEAGVLAALRSILLSDGI